MLLGGAPALGWALSCAAAPVAPVIRSATAVAAATCSCIDLPLEIGAGPTRGCESAMFVSALLESAVALLFGCVLDEWNGMRVAGGAGFAAMMIGFALLVARWDLSRGR